MALRPSSALAPGTLRVGALRPFWQPEAPTAPAARARMLNAPPTRGQRVLLVGVRLIAVPPLAVPRAARPAGGVDRSRRARCRTAPPPRSRSPDHLPPT